MQLPRVQNFAILRRKFNAGAGEVDADLVERVIGGSVVAPERPDTVRVFRELQ
jgi:hypothetical protein